MSVQAKFVGLHSAALADKDIFNESRVGVGGAELVGLAGSEPAGSESLSEDEEEKEEST